MIRVAFPLLGGALWTAGRTYLLNLFATLERFQPGSIAPLVLAPEGATEDELRPFRNIPSVEVVRVPADLETSRSRRWARALLAGRDSRFQDWLLRQRADLIFEQADYFGWRPEVPVLAWIPDLQHRKIDRQVGGGAAVGLHVGVLGAK